MKRPPPSTDPALAGTYEFALKKPREFPMNRRRSARLSSNPVRPPLVRKPRSTFGFPSLQGIDDPKKRRRILKKYRKRSIASLQPKWLPCPPTASESFIHEIPLDVKVVKKPFNDLERKCFEAFKFFSPDSPDYSNVETVDDEVTELAVSSRLDRRYDAEDFRRSYTYGCNNSMDRKTSILSSGTFIWTEKSSGKMWVAVHGVNSICVVTGSEALDVTRLGDYLDVFKPRHVLQLFMETLISEMEDLADPPTEACTRSFDKPFAVVSSIPASTDKVNEVSGREASRVVHDENRAINFLQEKMKSDSALTYGYSETLQIAVSSFLLLLGNELKAKDIKVCVWAKGLCTARHLLIRDAEKDLCVMYEPGVETLVERLSK